MNQQFYNTSKILSEELSHHVKHKLIKLSIKLAIKGSKKAAKKGNTKYKEHRLNKKQKEKADQIYNTLKQDLEK